jgi:class 3 adenylate cyclase
LPGSDHAPWADGDDIVPEIREFLTDVREPVTPDRVLATVLFTDIVASTGHATRLGDRRWRDLVSEHHRLIRHELARFRGREIDSAGDGFLAAFDGPAWALRVAQSIVHAVQPLGIQVRVGVHAGAWEILNDKLVAVAVHVGAGLAAAAGPSEVLTTGYGQRPARLWHRVRRPRYTTPERAGRPVAAVLGPEHLTRIRTSRRTCGIQASQTWHKRGALRRRAIPRLGGEPPPLPTPAIRLSRPPLSAVTYRNGGKVCIQ